MKNLALITSVAAMLFLASVAYAQTNFVYSLTLKYNGTALFNESLALTEGSAPDRINQPEKGFTLKVMSFDDKILYSFRFLAETTPVGAPPKDMFDENGNQIKIPTETLNQTVNSIVLTVPYFPNAKTLDIFDENGTQLLSVDVSSFSKYDANRFSKPRIDNIFSNSILTMLIVVVLVVGISFVIKRIVRNSATGSY